MENQIKGLIRQYQEIIAKLDNKLALYEQLGTPEQIAESLSVKLKSVVESNIRDVKVAKSPNLLEKRRREKTEEKRQEEVVEVIESLNLSSSVVSDMKSLLSKFK